MMAAGCVLFCGSASCGVAQAPVSQQLRSTHKKSWPREVGRLHRSGCLARVKGPAPPRGLKLSGRQALSQPWCPANWGSSSRRAVASAASVATTSFFRSMICTPVVQAKPRPGYTSSTNPLSRFRFAYSRRAHPLAHEPSRARVRALCMCEQGRVHVPLFRGKNTPAGLEPELA
jgi:hypothetical protein